MEKIVLLIGGFLNSITWVDVVTVLLLALLILLMIYIIYLIKEEQENTAIISYDELLERTSNNINYDEEYTNEYDDLFIRKVTEDSDTKEYVNLPEVIMMNYESEEDFLKALKKLQKNLVR